MKIIKGLCNFTSLVSRFIVLFYLMVLSGPLAYAAVGCQLNDPDRDVKQLFPQSTGYKTDFISIKEAGGLPLYKKIETILADKLDSIYETIDVPYSFYTILKGKEIIGYIHGVNQKGMFGGMQLILSTDITGKIINFYYQKISSPEAARFMDNNFTNKFIGLSLEDFLKREIYITDPSKDSNDDFKATLRGLKKNLILLHELKVK